MNPENSFIEKPSYSYVVATSRNSYRQFPIKTSSSSENSDFDSKPNYPDRSDLKTNRFQVHRRKLENMINTPSGIEGVNSAERYFKKIMETTDTIITWPRNLKPVTRKRKNPYVRVVGRPHDNDWAKALILAKLPTKCSLLKCEILKSFILVEPSYDIINTESIAIDIWAPTEPNIEWNFFKPPTAYPEMSTWNNFNYTDRSLELANVEHPTDGNEMLSPQMTVGNKRRNSTDWVVLKDSESPSSEEDNQNIQVDFDPEDLKAAFILMSLRVTS